LIALASFQHLAHPKHFIQSEKP